MGLPCAPRGDWQLAQATTPICYSLSYLISLSLAAGAGPAQKVMVSRPKKGCAFFGKFIPPFLIPPFRLRMTGVFLMHYNIIIIDP